MIFTENLYRNVPKMEFQKTTTKTNRFNTHWEKHFFNSSSVSTLMIEKFFILVSFRVLNG
ncbi:MAG: hypothetical protein CMP12_11795 [Zunongwangia sp.]|nr:hypothetical protein [Flavobacteriaceae bacterium]MAO36564.1 hypothetical protein [Zunongwangia sp.]